MAGFQKLHWSRPRKAPPLLLGVGFSLLVLAVTTPRIPANEGNTATASFVVVGGGKPARPGVGGTPQNHSPLAACFLFVPPADSVTLNKYPEFRRWIETHRDRPAPKQHQFRLEGNAIVPAAAILRVGDSVGRFLSRETPLSLALFSNPPIGPAPSTIHNYTFAHTEMLPVKLSAIGQAATEAHALILDHGFAAVSDMKGRAEITGLPTGMDIPLRVALPTARHRVSFQSDALRIKNSGRLVLRLEGDAQKPLRIIVAPDTP